ncbi:MAG: hypothetical protein QM758_00865 [Armatimonas sp.]
MLNLVCHILHLAATCTSLGGLFYARAVLWPSLPSLLEAEREPFLKRMIARFALIKWTGVGVIAVTGIVQWLAIFPQIKDPRGYLIAFGIKMIGAVGLFGITFLLALPNERLKGMQRHRGLWSGINIVCGLLILTGAALMREARLGAH